MDDDILCAWKWTQMFVPLEFKQLIILSFLCKIDVHDRAYIDGLVQERCNSSALAIELCLSCTNPIDIRDQ